jgi:hypothetical protein
MISTGVPFTANVCIYLDLNEDSTYDWALIYDISTGSGTSIKLYQNVASVWTYSTTGYAEAEYGYLELGTTFTSMSMTVGEDFNYYVTTETDTSTAEDKPGDGSNIDRAPDGTNSTSYSTMPEFYDIFVPVIAIFILVLIIRKRRHQNRYRKQKLDKGKGVNA